MAFSDELPESILAENAELSSSWHCPRQCCSFNLMAMLRLILLSAAAFLAIGPPAAAQTAGGPPVVVTIGEAVVKRMPDRAWIGVTVESQASSPQRAQEMSARRMADVLAKLHSAGIGKDAIQTTAYDLHPEYDYIEGAQNLRGFVARSTLEVRVDNLEHLGKVLDLVVSAGASSVSGVRFDLKDRESAETTALQEAVAAARERAKAAAAGAGLAVQRILKIEEHGVTSARPRPIPMAARAEFADAAVPIAPGEMEIRASVTLTTELR